MIAEVASGSQSLPVSALVVADHPSLPRTLDSREVRELRRQILAGLGLQKGLIHLICLTSYRGLNSLPSYKNTHVYHTR